MVPQQLILKNFLSYQDVSLNFRGLHTACICGSNGAGKSSLLEAITWAIWGKCRAESEDDVLHNGTDQVRVDFEFISNNQTYRIIRSRQRGRSSVTEFQIKSGDHFRTLSAKGLRATQEKITNTLKLDYETFVNSAYLRQGRADEFMLRKPSERKQILADLLKLDQYEMLATRAKDISKEAKGKINILDERLQILEQDLNQRPDVVANQAKLVAEITEVQAQQQQTQWQLQQLQTSQNQRQQWQKQAGWQQRQCQELTTEIARLENQNEEINQQCQKLKLLLEQEAVIQVNFQRYQTLQSQETELAKAFQQYQNLQQQRQDLEQQLQRQENELARQTEQQLLRLEHLDKQLAELQPILAQQQDIEADLDKLKIAKQKLSQLDNLQHQVAPLLQRRSALQGDLARARAQCQAQLEQRQAIAKQLQIAIAAIPEQRRAFQALDEEIFQLKNKQVYLKRVEEKGQERGHFKERLQENQRLFEKQLRELEQKLTLLGIPGATCPLCEQGLDGHYHQQVIEKTEHQCQELRNQIWILKEQITLADQELAILRNEYKEIADGLTNLEQLLQHYGQMEAELEKSGENHEQLVELNEQIADLELSLTEGNFAESLQLELAALERELTNLAYDEQTHALARSTVDQLRKGEIRQAKLKEAQSKYRQLTGDRPGLEQKLLALRSQLQSLGTSSPLRQQWQQVSTAISELNYNNETHQQLLGELRRQQPWQLKHQELEQARQQLPILIQRGQEYQDLIGDRQRALEERQGELAQLEEQIRQYADHGEQIKLLEQELAQRRQQLDNLLAKKGGLEQLLIQIDTLQGEYEETKQQFDQAKKQFRIHQELGKAFGKDGIQVMIIENILPQLEAETNYILARLTGNQHHIQFVTQKEGKSSTKNKPKMINTLDILIADAQGTRPYETYSGGEAFRINFSIRLALAKLLAQRSGTALQLLIIDEGFGTQDADGCDRLVAAITAIASDFACILTVTHMPQFREAFQQRIEVNKTEFGSQLAIVS
ncbi:slr1048 [Synechocystis sp. PCC 6803]|uniref:Nuclease SbcCD subunit C n=1 Tax=Synechocystis sp. (strain ATCC 27184 / PCC 6803 / Kazusa) TaxID=1111708 RepID=P73012_SYNY3|nr:MULTISPECIES: exonuclease subunit SbcC [unclassified Synechocystis]BAM50747.1 hypothetical protein BEST7613_1816 [Synechocystis sp. PCC 6803] [Bacillus subtilis BEST7613]AGF50722.1 hypothetical protein MYO_14620 [Synechocystis sp. PCC 6803]ALJ66783.1 exonuclease SbcC [Synechocystis sp. PCC 6803]AVP88625.1 exonuclease subunit SbcC [Synechocystis sp. IPPAS B-1465]MBD2618300.1 exonuclease subunit SbcC [Synechocystis sp. FACHB-898]